MFKSDYIMDIIVAIQKKLNVSKIKYIEHEYKVRLKKRILEVKVEVVDNY